MSASNPVPECPTCAGCGQIANDDGRTPWKYWAELPLRSSAAVLSGIVQPIICPDCAGTGKESDAHPLDKPLGEIHEIALVLQSRHGLTHIATRLAVAYQTIQDYLVKHED